MTEKTETRPPKEQVEERDLLAPKSIQKEIDKVNKLQGCDPSLAEGMLREIDNMIKLLPDEAKEKKNLEFSLRQAAVFGLSKDLQELMRSNGLANEALTLVREYLTTKPDLARFFVDTPDDQVPDSMKMIKRKLGAKLEVLGELINRGYDPSEMRVKKLIEAAPSLHELYKLVKSTKKLRELKFDVEERKEIHNLAKADSSVDGKNNAVKQKKKEEKNKKLDKAKELMSQAKKLASENMEKNKKDVDEKIEQIRKLVELPSDWNNMDKDSPIVMLEKLKGKIHEMGDFEESVENFDSVEEIVTHASGGLALKGIYYSKWENYQTSNVPILKPPQKVDSWNTQSPYETGFRQFSEGNYAALFSKEVESSGFTHADSVCGFAGLFGGQASATYGSQTTDESEISSKASTTSVSATNFCRSAMKCFAVPRNCLNLTEQACNMALNIMEGTTKDEMTKEEIRRFFKIFGSHVPFGVHQLGGLFFTMSTATSQKEMDTSKLMHLNATKLTTQVSAGFFGGALGVGGTDMHEHSSSKGSTTATQIENESVNYTFSVKSIGPHADNPASFKKSLSTNNGTWAILDRGDTDVNVPVWDLLREEGQKYHYIAKKMEETWKEDEEKKRDRKEIRQTMNNLLRLAESGRPDPSGSFPLKAKVSKGGKIKIYTVALKLKEAFAKAIDFICQNPHHHICEIHRNGPSITVTGWSADTGITYEEADEGHYLLYHLGYMKPENNILRIVAFS